MRTSFQIAKIINIVALICLIAGPYGSMFTGFLQIVAAIFFLITFPKDKWIYSYFTLTALFFITAKIAIDTFNGWVIVTPIFLIFYLSYIIHFKKTNHEL